MELSLYFEPVDFNRIRFENSAQENRLGSKITLLDETWSDEALLNLDAVIIGVNEDRLSLQNLGCANAPDEIRKHLYNLFPAKNFPKIADLGNIRAGDQISDTFFALKNTVLRLLEAGIKIVIIGGSQNLTFPVYQGYEEIGRVINLVTIDATFDNQPVGEFPDSQSYLSAITYRKPSFLFNFSNIGYQNYLVDQNEVKHLEDLYFDTFRLGLMREDLQEAEPTIRNADFLSFDISAIRASDAPGNYYASPNGFYGEEACQLMRYAGLSSKLSTIGFFETNPLFDRSGQTSHLTAQLIWHFFDGLSNRIDDYPQENSRFFLKYIVNENATGDMTFYKSQLSGRWWMQLPIARNKEKLFARHIMVPCSYNDYLKACNNEIPDRWWKAYQKLM